MQQVLARWGMRKWEWVSRIAGVKLILRITNVVPLFMAFLIVGTVWKQGWQHLGANAKSRVIQAIAAAGAYQWP